MGQARIASSIGAVMSAGRKWSVIVTRGHAFEHVSLYDAAANILIAGDHLLPKISPVIAVYEMMPMADPLGDYLESFASFTNVRPDVLVLPSHGMPYIGISERIVQLRAHHDKRLSAALDFLSEPLVPLVLTRTKFPNIENPDDLFDNFDQR